MIGGGKQRDNVVAVGQNLHDQGHAVNAANSKRPAAATRARNCVAVGKCPACQLHSIFPSQPIKECAYYRTGRSRGATCYKITNTCRPAAAGLLKSLLVRRGCNNALGASNAAEHHITNAKLP